MGRYVRRHLLRTQSTLTRTKPDFWCKREVAPKIRCPTAGFACLCLY